MAEISDDDRRKAKAFFDRGATVAGTGQYDYAIEMFMQGFNFDPDAVEAHQTLRDISLKRKVSGGKALGMWDAMKLKKPSKDDKQNMLSAVKLLAHDPGNTDHMLWLMQSAYKADFNKTTMWIAAILFRANSDSPKPELSKFIAVKDTYKAVQHWELAVQAAQAAANLRPEDMDLQTELKHLGAQHTMVKGKFGTAANFSESVKDMDAQKKLMDADKDVRDLDVLSRQVIDAEAEWRAQPEETGKIMKYVDALLKTEDTKNENRAIDLLAASYERTQQFRFRFTAGTIKLRQLDRAERVLKDKAAKNPKDPAVVEEYRQFMADKTEEELKEFTLFAENYPTDLTHKFQMAKRLFMLQRFGEAIPVLQTARQDPKLRIDASIFLGRAFLEAEFIDEAVETLKTLIDEYQLKGDSRSKEMYYWYARSLEAHGDTQLAIKAYSQLAQWDFNYRDVQVRIKKLRSAGSGPGGAAPAAAT